MSVAQDPERRGWASAGQSVWRGTPPQSAPHSLASARALPVPCAARWGRDSQVAHAACATPAAPCLRRSRIGLLLKCRLSSMGPAGCTRGPQRSWCQCLRLDMQGHRSQCGSLWRWNIHTKAEHTTGELSSGQEALLRKLQDLPGEIWMACKRRNVMYKAHPRAHRVQWALELII